MVSLERYREVIDPLPLSGRGHVAKAIRKSISLYVVFTEYKRRIQILVILVNRHLVIQRPTFIIHHTFSQRGHEGCVTALHFTNECDITNYQPTLISGSKIGEIFIWNLKTFRTIYRLKNHDGKPVLYLYYYKSALISHGRNDFLNIWKFQNQAWSIIRQLQSPNIAFCAAELYFTQNSANIVLFNNNTHTLKIHDYEKENVSKTLKMKNDGMCMCIKSIELKSINCLLAGYESGEVGLWYCESEQEISRLKLHEEPIMCLDYDSQHRNRGVTGSVDKSLRIWTISEDLALTEVKTVITNSELTAVKIREDGKILITGSTDSSIRIFSWKNLKLLALLNFHLQSISVLSCCPFSIDKQKSVFASGSDDKSIALWSLY
ncbi:guanine nucleotide-binding protein subunit beta-like protein 1 [Caerostris extrusa]|uniref:Guanine nucleotide-binding protein subunit beta-like protein 1 n=1 Tax=Caerostris extrusa TaxID=172846 RepID=A0AAV4Q262_CAEEX|nr:guanine nucleotide-binding protein subunit beta-like protein 1 [Caerostris extrusa]